MTGIPFLIVFVIAIVVMIVLISKFKVHPFLSILSLADMVVGLVGEKHPELAIELMGWVVSIPVFCDSGFVVLNPIRKALVKRTGASSVTMTLCLAAGLYTAHVFIPPTPGPIAAANTLGVGNNLLLVMGLRALTCIPALTGAYFWAKYIGKKVKSSDETISNDEVVKSYEELKASNGKLPSRFLSTAPIIVPIILMALSSIATVLGWTGALKTTCIFLGTPIIALAVGDVLGIILLTSCDRTDKLYKLTDDTLKTTGPILFVTAAGGVLGKIISSTSLVTFITANATVLQPIGIFFPFIIAAILKTAQGSSTVAITTTAGIMALLLELLGMSSPIMACLCVMAIGAGAMTVSHDNDSYFWVVTNFGDMSPDQGYKTETVNTLVMGICSILFIFVLSIFFK